MSCRARSSVLLALVSTIGAVGGARATSLEVGTAPFARATHGSHASADVRADAEPALEQATTAAVGGAGGTLVITPTFDSSITSDPNAAAIEAMINAAVAVYGSLFDDPITINIRFRYSTTYADGTTPLSGGLIAASETGLYVLSWSTYVDALVADAKTANDATANASLPGSALTTHVDTASATGRAVGLATTPIMFADGSLGAGGLYDGIVTINSAIPLKFTRPPAVGIYDAQRSVEHEIDEVLGLGSSVDKYPDYRPQDLFAWSGPGTRSFSSSGSRYFSIDGGATSIVGFNQDPNGDFGDWLSATCPQATPYVQNAFSCPNQTSDVTQTSPEGVNLDVIGYDLLTGSPTTTNTSSTTTTPATSTTTTTAGACQSPQVSCCPGGQSNCGVCGTDCGNGGCCPSADPICDNSNGTCLVCAPPQVQCCPAGQPGCGQCGTDCGGGACCPADHPLCDSANGRCLVEPQCGAGQIACHDGALGFTDVACCTLPAKGKQCGAACSQIVAACKASCATTTKPKKCKKRCRASLVGHCRQSRPHACS
jgi:hypothetical protein